MTIALPSLISTGIQAYGAKRAADMAKQAKRRAEEQLKNAQDAQARAAEAKAKSDQAIKDQLQAQQGLELQAQQGLGPNGTILTAKSQNQILGMDPIILAGGGLAILGIGAAIFMRTRN